MTSIEFLTALWGSTTGSFRLFHDVDKSVHGENIDGDFKTWEWYLKDRNEAGFGVFAIINSGGHSDADINTFNSCFIDVDVDRGLPDNWHIEPSIVCTRSGKYHAYWLLDDPIITADQWVTIQKRLATYYGGDPTVCNPSRVMRLPDFNHMKNPDDPSRYRVVKYQPEIKYSSQHLTTGLPEAPPQLSPIANNQVEHSTEYDDSVVNISSFTRYCNGIPPAIEGEGGNHQTFGVFIGARKFSLSPEMAVSIVESDYNFKCVPPWSHVELETLAGNAYKYAKLPDQGSKSVTFGDTVVPGGVTEQGAVVPDGVTEQGAVVAQYNFNTPMAIHEWHPLQVNSKGKPLPTLDNFKRLLACYRVDVGYDLVGKEVLMNGDCFIHDSDLKHNANHAQIYSLCQLNGFNVGMIDQYIYQMMAQNEVNPVEEWINSKPWDGTDRIGQLFNTLTLEDDNDRDISYMLFRKWLIGASSIVTRRINQFEYVLVLQADLGGEGKTAWFKKLCPEFWRIDGLLLDPTDKDSIINGISHWLVELGELDSTFRKADIKRLMAFLSLDKDKLRLPFAKAFNVYGRRTAFFGTVNQRNILGDDSGDRRFWMLSVTSINYEHTIDMQQVWAQASQAGISGERHWLNPEENRAVIDRNTEQYKTENPIDELLSTLFADIDPDNELVHMTISQILFKAGMEHPNQGQLNKAGNWLRNKLYRRATIKGKRGFYVPKLPLF